MFHISDEVIIATFDLEKCIQDDCYYARKYERPILKRGEQLEEPIMRIRVLDFHIQFWNSCLTEEDVNYFSIYACLQHHFGDLETITNLYSTFGVMYAFNCCISTPKLRLKSLPTPLDSMKRVERITKITVKASCSNIPSSEHENTVVKTLTERVQELEAQLENQKKLTENVNLQLCSEKIKNQKLQKIIDDGKIVSADSEDEDTHCHLCLTKLTTIKQLERHLDDYHPEIFVTNLPKKKKKNK